MIFRPRIFISSTFKENTQLRNRIRDYFYSVGAEPLLYEKELTPSVKPLTYRDNVLDADFMILIVKDEYGTKTETGLSGIHEEYFIAKNNGVPIHVYLKKNHSNDRELTNPLIDDLRNDGISYYYFEDDEDLLNRLKETTFTIAIEIKLSQFMDNKVSDSKLFKLSGQRDYERGMEVINIIESMKNIARKNEIDYINSNLLIVCFEGIIYEFSSTKHQFMNWKIEDKLHELLICAHEFIEHSVNEFNSNGFYREYHISVLGKIEVTNFDSQKYQDGWNRDNYKTKLNEIMQKYEEFKKLIQELRMDIDLER